MSDFKTFILLWSGYICENISWTLFLNAVTLLRNILILFDFVLKILLGGTRIVFSLGLILPTTEAEPFCVCYPISCKLWVWVFVFFSLLLMWTGTIPGLYELQGFPPLILSNGSFLNLGSFSEGLHWISTLFLLRWPLYRSPELSACSSLLSCTPPVNASCLSLHQFPGLFPQFREATGLNVDPFLIIQLEISLDRQLCIQKVPLCFLCLWNHCLSLLESVSWSPFFHRYFPLWGMLYISFAASRSPKVYL